MEDRRATSCRRGARRRWSTTSKGAELVTNASNFVRGYDPRTGKELWRLGRSSKITAPTPIAAGDLIVVASGRAPGAADLRGQGRRARRHHARATARPSSAGGRLEQDRPRLLHADAAGLPGHRSTSSPTTACSTPTICRPARRSIGSACRVVGSGFSASPVAADGKIYLSNEDGEMLVVAGRPRRSSSWRPTRWASC